MTSEEMQAAQQIPRSAVEALREENARCREIAERAGRDYGDLKAKLTSLEKERDRYKAALEKIAARDAPVSAEIAKDALSQKGGEERACFNCGEAPCRCPS